MRMIDNERWTLIWLSSLCIFSGGMALLSAEKAHKQSNILPPPGYYAVEGFTLHDGDTFVADIKLPWNITLRDQHVRCAGYDAYEITKARQTVQVTDAEIEKGKAALSDLQGLVSGGEPFVAPVYDAKGKQLDSVYGRLQGTLIVRLKDGTIVDVAEWMQKRGHCRLEE